jgi:hypothetical protein
MKHLCESLPVVTYVHCAVGDGVDVVSTEVLVANATYWERIA